MQTSISDLIIWLRWRPNASRMHPIFTFKEDQRQTPAFGNQISPRFRQHRAAVSALGDKPSAAIQIQANSLNFQGVERWANRGGGQSWIPLFPGTARGSISVPASPHGSLDS